MGVEGHYEIWWKTKDGKLDCVVVGLEEGAEQMRKRLWKALLARGPEAISWAGLKKIGPDGSEEVLMRGQRQLLPEANGDIEGLRRWGPWEWRFPARAAREIAQR